MMKSMETYGNERYERCEILYDYCEAHIAHLIDRAMRTHSSIEQHICRDPMQMMSRFRALTLDRSTMIAIVRTIREKVLHAIFEMRAQRTRRGRLDKWLREAIARNERRSIGSVCIFCRNLLMGIGILPSYGSIYSEQENDLGAKLYYIEDILLAMSGTMDGEICSPPEAGDPLQ